MKHFRPDYQNRIVDLANKIPDNEPVLLFRGQDKAALSALHAYLVECVRIKASPLHIKAIRTAIDSFTMWQREKASKIPDTPESAEALPMSDHPLLTQKLNELEKEKQKNADLAETLERIKKQNEEYSERYSDLKTLHSNTAAELEAAVNNGIDLGKALEGAKQELTQVKFDLSRAIAVTENAEKERAIALKNVEELQAVNSDLAKEIQTLTTALKNCQEIDLDKGEQG